MNGTSAFEIDHVKATYAAHLEAMDFLDLRDLASQMASLVECPGWRVLERRFNQEGSLVADLAIQTGEIDKHMAGVIAGYQRIIRFPQIVKEVYEEVDARKAHGGASHE